MHRTFSFLLLMLLVPTAWVRAEHHQRISQTKCEEYYHEASATGNNCDRDMFVPDRAQEGDFPHTANIGRKKDVRSAGYEFYLSGSLISDRYILTVAHGFKFKSPDVVRLGAIDLREESYDQMDYEVEEVVIHPNYTTSPVYNDIALVKLRESVSFTEYIRPACLWNSMQMNFTSLTGTGFGLNAFGSPLGQLKKFNLKIMNKSFCTRLYSQTFPDGVKEHQMCLGADDCQANSGSPAQVTLGSEDCVPYIVGITSFGRGCGDAQFPDIYTRVASYIDWIEAIVWS